MTINTGGSAFPVLRELLGEEFHGITLRDYFAAGAMNAMCSSISFLKDGESARPDEIAAAAYAVADAMLAAREETTK